MDFADFKARYGPRCVVAGASEGIGAAFALEAARRGLDVVLVARRQRPLDVLAETVARETGSSAITISLDYTDPDAARQPNPTSGASLTLGARV